MRQPAGDVQVSGYSARGVGAIGLGEDARLAPGVGSVRLEMLPREQMTDIHNAVERGQTARVREILRADPATVHSRNRVYDMPLHLAAHHGRAAIAELLLDAGAAIDEKGDHGRTPLHFAVVSRSRK